MSGSSPDDKRVGDATLQRIDDLAGGWSVPKRTPRPDGDQSPPPAEPTEPDAQATEGKVAAGSGANSGDKSRGAKKKKGREKTRAKGKERGKTAAARRAPPDASIPPLLHSLRGTEQPPEARPAARPEPRGEGSPDDPDDHDDSDDRAATVVSDRAATRALSERVATHVSDRAATRLVPGRDHSDSADNAATLIYGDRASTEIDHPLLEDDAEAAAQPASIGRASDETMLSPPGSGALAVARADAARMAGSTTAILRLPPSLPRRPGPHGDVLYVFSAVFGVARANRELSAADRQLEAEKQSRGRRLADLARLSLADSDLESETVTRGREEIIEMEDQRSRKAGAVAAADAEIAALERDRAEDKQQIVQELEALRREDKECEERLSPLQRRVHAIRRRGFRLLESIEDLDRRVARSHSRLSRLAGEEKTTAEAYIASMRAERQAMADEQPTLAAELDELEPAIADLIASRADRKERVARLGKEERDALVRTAEKVTAVRARRVVDERAEAELAQDQEEALAALGERLAVERPPELGSRLRGIEEHEVAIATLERRHLELTELVRGVDRWALARGVLWLLVMGVGVATALVWSYALRAP